MSTETPLDSEPDRTARLEEEGEIAADYLEELLDIADLDGDIDLDIRHGRASVEIVAEDSASLDRLVGRDGEVLEALQELTRLAVQTRSGERSRLMLDVAGYRAARREALTRLAEKAVEEVRASGSEVALDPLNAFERKVVHDVVATAGLVSDSRGVEPERYVVVQPAQAD
jgi:spoIIIJ-associated protein